MYLFQDKDTVEISTNCKFCLQEIKFSITAEEYKNTLKFPIKKEFIHGEPKHNLIIFLNKNLEIENFEIQTIIDKKASYSEELTKTVLSNIGLTPEEIELYFLTTGREAVSIGEMALLIDKPKEECEAIAKKFVEKGLFKEIIGAKPHYRALPPYAALVAQLEDFNKFISEIKDVAPKELNKSFTELEAQTEGLKRLDEYSKFIQDLKDQALKRMLDQKKHFDNTIKQIGQIREITKAISSLEKDTSAILVEQLSSLKERFQSILKQISQILQNQISELKNEFKNIQDTTSENLAKLRLGVIQQAVEQVIQKTFTARLEYITQVLKKHLETIKRIFTEGLKQTITGFNENLLNKLKGTIEDIVNSVDNITSSTEKSGDEIKNIFADVSKNFSQAVILADEKLGDISMSILDSFNNLKDTFSTKVIESLNTELGKILERLEISEITTKEFWEKEKETTQFTMQDIWFIRSVEGAQAHIDDEIMRAKMRILIVAPSLTDINVNLLKQLPRHVNIRIAANIDLGNPEHQNIINQLDEMQNVSYRHRDLKNIWGINRDYEEVILCVISKTIIQGKEMTEIAGIGSIIEEHIKIFVPILEDAWVGAHKDLTRAIKPGLIKAATQTTALTSARQRPMQYMQQKVEPKPQPTSPTSAPTLTPSISTSPLPPTTAPGITTSDTPSSPTLQEQQKPSVIDLLEKGKTVPESTPAEISEHITQPISTTPESLKMGAGSLSEQLDFIITNIKKMNAIELANALMTFNESYSKEKGYSSVLNQINLTINQLQQNPGGFDASQIINKINFWRKKLHV
ncbi:MAG: hypothetical protein ACTSQP_19375 [Promethearchaeota archaeon]